MMPGGRDQTGPSCPTAEPAGWGPGWESVRQAEQGERQRREMTVAEVALTHCGGDSQSWAPSGPLPHPGGDSKTSVNLADPGPGCRHSRGEGHGGSGREVTVAASRGVALLWQQGRDGASVPPDLDGRELPEVGVAHVQQATEGRGAPLERRQLVPRGATGCQKAQGLGQRHASHLGAGAEQAAGWPPGLGSKLTPPRGPRRPP